MTNIITYRINKKPTNIFGLLYEPELINFTYKNKILTPKEEGYWMEDYEPPQPFTKDNQNLLSNLIIERKPKTIMEIGVFEHGGESATKTMFKVKNNDCIYMGIDVVDKSELNDKVKNIFTFQVNSKFHDKVYMFMNRIGIKIIDLLFIDGGHDFVSVLRDWKYVEKLSKNGLVLMHDVNKSIGPQIIFDAIDDNLFEKQRHFTWEEGYKDAGLGVAIRR